MAWYTKKLVWRIGMVEIADHEAMNHLCFNVPYWPAIILHDHLFCLAGSRGFSSPLTNNLTCLHPIWACACICHEGKTKQQLCGETKFNLLPGQGPSSQSWLSKESPIHFPPGPGGGLSHRRVLIAVPGPHDSLQELQRLHSLQPPLTTKVKETKKDLVL